MKHYILILVILITTGCASIKSDRCLTYTISGDSVAWKPTRIYQSESSQNQLYIEIPKSANYVPNLEVLDTEFDQPYKVDYTYDSITHRFKVDDNYSKYVLSRETYDGIDKDSVYITCNRKK